LPEDLEGFHRASRDQPAANLRKAEYPGLVGLDGAEPVSCRFTARTGPNEAKGGSFFGAAFRIWIAPEPGLLLPAGTGAGPPRDRLFP